MNRRSWEAMKKRVNASKMPNKFYGGNQIAILAGSSLVIDAIVFEASRDSGIPMDWHYVGGRAIIYALGDVEKAKSALGFAFPTGGNTLPYHEK